MATQPVPPSGLPKYLTEGIPKQDDETLRALQAWIDELLTYRQEIAADEIEPAADADSIRFDRFDRICA